MKKSGLRNINGLVLAAFMTALSVVIGWVCKTYLTFGDGSIRVTFENMPVILAAIWLGPVVGAVVGAASDVISALLSGYAINPLITIGAAALGLVAGLMFRMVKGNKLALKTVVSVFLAHGIGSVAIKSYALHLYGYAVIMGVRIPLYIGIALAEAYLIYILYKNKGISSRVERMLRK